jgi:predicted oxidoreductase
MENIKIGSSALCTSAIVAGCMRISKMTDQEAARFLVTALENGINLFDHADIYGKGQSEEVFAKAMATSKTPRDSLYIQSKCSIRKGLYDFSKSYILQSVDGILKRLGTDYLDLLLLHRPDSLMEPEEVAGAFDQLESSGKVRHFGVSNQNSMQIELLKKSVKQRIVANQLQFSIMHTGIIDSGINVNMKNKGAVDNDGHILEYSRVNDITIQAWSPLQFGFFEGTFLGNEKFPEVNKVLDRIAGERGVAASAVAIAWILRHPAKMQTIVGTTNATRLAEMAQASKVALSREEWYEIYLAAGNTLP